MRFPRTGNVIPFASRVPLIEIEQRVTQRSLDDARRLALEEAASGRDGLVVLLEGLCGRVLDARFRVDALARLGGQLAVFRGVDLHSGESVAVKMPLVDYRRPVSFGSRRLEAIRADMARAAQTLTRLAPLARFPRLCALVHEKNPFLKGPREAWAAETFLVEEWVHGVSLDALRTEMARDPFRFGSVARQLVLGLASILPAVFCDVASRNFLHCPRSRRLRFVDAGSVVDAGTTLWSGEAGNVRIHHPTTLVFLPSRATLAHAAGVEAVADAETMFRSAGKLLHALRTNLHPVLGIDPRFDHPAFFALPVRDREGLRALLEGKVTRGSHARELVEACWPEEKK
jgi:hypothetical protein